MRFYKVQCTAAMLFLSLSMPLSLKAGAPTDQLRETVDKLFATVDALRHDQLTIPELRARVSRLLAERFDFVEMARRSLGAHWSELMPEDRRDFVETFVGLLEGTYGATLKSYGGEKVMYEREVENGDYAQVDTKILTRNGQETSVDYRLKLSNGEWKVYDVVIDNISLVSNYRSQFNRVIAASSYKDLVRRMKENQARMS